MMLTVSQSVFSQLLAFNAANGDLFGGDIFPMLAPMKASYPFCVYRASKSTEFSKAGVHDVQLQVLVVGEDYDQLCGITDDLEIYFRQNFRDAFYESTRPLLNEERPKEISIQITFNLKMIQ